MTECKNCGFPHDDAEARGKGVRIIGRIHNLERRLDEVIRRLDLIYPDFEDMVAKPEILHPPREDKKVIVGGYYRTLGGHVAHITWPLKDGQVFVGSAKTYQDIILTREESWDEKGRSVGRSGDGYDLDLSTYQPQPFEE